MLNEPNPPDPVSATLQPPEPRDRPAPIHPDRLLNLGATLGVVMIIAALLWVNGVRKESLGAELALADAWQVVPGMAIGAAFAALVWTLGRRLEATRQITALLEEVRRELASEPVRAVLLTTLEARPALRDAIQPERPDVPVVAYQELMPNTNITPLARVGE